MILRLEAWLVALCVVTTTASESHPCPCIPRNLCPRVFGTSPVDEKVTGPMKPCSNPGTVHCCGTSVSLQEQQPIHAAVAEELRKEEQLMVIVNNAIERMIEPYAVEDIQREDKSIGITNKNNLSCSQGQCSDEPEGKRRLLNETNKSGSTLPGQNEFNNSSNTTFSSSKLTEILSPNGTLEKLYIVYAQHPNKKTAYLGQESKAQIVLPTTEPKQETLAVQGSATGESENEPQESSIDPIQEANPDESLTQTKTKLSRFHKRNQLNNRKSDRLEKLFPKRRPPLQVPSKSSTDKDESYQNGDDVEIAASNLDEVIDSEPFDDHSVAVDYAEDEEVYDEEVPTDEEFPTQVTLPLSPTNLQNKTEQTEPRRRPLPPRRLTPQPQQKPEENKQTTKSALDLLRSRTKSRNDPAVHKPIEEPMKITQHEPVKEHVAMEMDEINVKAINDMMKTNFTGRSSLRSNTAFKPARAPLKTTNNRLASSSNRNNQEPKHTESPSQPRRPNIQHSQPKPQTQTASPTTSNHEQSITHGTSVSEENKVHRFQLKPRPSLRTQNSKLPSTLVSQISMTQETAFDTSRDSPNDQFQARKPFRRVKTRPEVTTQSTADKPPAAQLSQGSEDQTKPTPSVPPFTRKRLLTRDRLRQRIESTNNNRNKPNEELKITSPEPQKSNSKNPLRSGFTNEEDTTTNNDEFTSSPSKSGEDLDGSGSDFDFQQYQSRGNGKFVAPSELESGFHPMPPMMESRELKVIGPLPGGFIDRASGFSEGDEIGLQPPLPNFATQFNNEGNFNQNNRPQLSSAFPGPQPQTQFKNDGNFNQNNRPHLSSAFPGPQSQTQFKSDGNFNQNNRPLTLLPPVFPIAQPQITTRTQFSPKFQATEPLPFLELEEETPQIQEEGDLAQIQNQFGTLKNQYDTLLNRYAETLNIYIGQYKKLINSAPPSIR